MLAASHQRLANLYFVASTRIGEFVIGQIYGSGSGKNKRIKVLVRNWSKICGMNSVSDAFHIKDVTLATYSGETVLQFSITFRPTSNQLPVAVHF